MLTFVGCVIGVLIVDDLCMVCSLMFCFIIFWFFFFLILILLFFFFFFQAEDGIRDGTVTGVQTCALPISGAKPKFDYSKIGFGEKQRQNLSDSIAKEKEGSDKDDKRTGGFTQVEGGKRSEERRVGKECRSRWSPDH